MSLQQQLVLSENDVEARRPVANALLDFAPLVESDESDWPEMNYQGVHHVFPNTTLSFTHAFDRKTPVVTMSRVFPGESVGEATALISTYSRDVGRDDSADARDTKEAKDADALIARGRPTTKNIIDSLEKCRIIALGSVGADSVDVAAATARGIPVTNVPDT